MNTTNIHIKKIQNSLKFLKYKMLRYKYKIYENMKCLKNNKTQFSRSGNII